ncbi:MAG: alpha/beta hydrolase [Planctomycetes bacterium]|nr:alpha/beta hydrolase [Planctomycetota bacterium]
MSESASLPGIERTTSTLPGNGEPDLFCRHWTPAQSKGTVAIVHGLGEHSGRYDEVATFLASRGFFATAYDQRGFGKSGGPRAHVPAWGEYAGDLGRFLETVQPDRSPVFLLAHSMGGLVAFDFLETGSCPKVRGIVATSPLLGVAVRVPAWKGVLGRVASRLLPRLSLPTEVQPTDLTHDPAKIAEYEADGLIHEKATARWYTEMLAALVRVHANASRIQVPSLVIHAGADRVTDPEASRRFVERIGHPDREFRRREGEFHEVLNETNRAGLYEEIADWFLARIPA